MTSKKHTKRALLLSVLAMVLCLAMLMGSTFAWFTDSATTGVNKIQAGNLDIQLLNADGTESLEGESMAFQKAAGAPEGEQVLWEPGATYYTQGFQIKNAGSLYLKFNMAFNGITGGDAELLKAIDFYITTRKPANAEKPADALTLGAFNGAEYTLAPGQYFDGTSEDGSAEAVTLYLVGHMKEEADNDYMNKSIDGIGITVNATQTPHESDSFDNQYDKLAEYPVLESATNWYETDKSAQSFTISNGSQLAYLAELVSSGEETFAGKTITLEKDIVLDGVSNWIPIGTDFTHTFEGTFDGAGHKVSQFNFNETTAGAFNYTGFFGVVYNATIKNLTVEGNLTLTAKEGEIFSCGGICGYAGGYSTFENCTNKVNIDGTNVANNVNSGVLVGGILGAYASNSGNMITIDSCTNYGNITVGNDTLEEAMCVAGGITALKFPSIIIINDNCENVGTVTSAGKSSMHDPIAFILE